MDDGRARRALAHAEAKLEDPDDVAGSLAYIISSCQDVLDVDAVGVMVASRSARLQLLAASTHRAAELELHQSQIDEGPCVDAAADGVSVALSDQEAICRRWPIFGPAMIEAGFSAVHSAPLRVGSGQLGAMALFRRDPVPFDEAEDGAAQAYADLVTRAVTGRPDVAPEDVAELVERALAGRVAIERAKGVVAQTSDVDLAEAYERVREKAAREGRTLTAAAADLIDSATRDDARG